MKTSIIIPAYNEEKRIKKTLEKYCVYLKSKGVDFEILVVINNTKDKTPEVVEEAQKKFKEISFLNFKMGGKGFAILEGFKDALNRKNDLIGFVDADMATPPEEFYKLITGIKLAEGIIASRNLKKSEVVGKTFIGDLKSSLFNFVVRGIMVLPYRDTQCGAKLFKREVIKKVIKNVGTTKWAFDVDLLSQIHRRGFKIKEIPTKWAEQEGSKRDLIRTSLKMFVAVVRLRLKYSPFKFVVRFYDQLPDKLKVAI